MDLLAWDDVFRLQQFTVNCARSFRATVIPARRNDRCHVDAEAYSGTTRFCARAQISSAAPTNTNTAARPMSRRAQCCVSWNRI